VVTKYVANEKIHPSLRMVLGQLKSKVEGGRKQ